MPRILITKFRRTGAAGAGDELRRAVEDAGVDIALAAGGGFVADVDESALSRIDKQGFRWVELPEPEILRIGAFTIDTRTDGVGADVPGDLRVPDDEARDWSHRLIQLAAPPAPEWVAALQQLGIRVIEPIGRYGLFVLAGEDQAKRAESLEFVAWSGVFHPAYRIHPELARASGLVEFVAVDVVPPEDVGEVRGALEALGARVRTVEEPPPGETTTPATVVVDIEADRLPEVARMPSVRWLERHGPPIPTDERSVQIVAENLDGAAPPNTAPVTGYQAALTALGLSGAGVRVGIADTGVDNHDNATMHGDLAGRFDFFFDTTSGAVPVDRDGHGTHVAGIAVGNAALGDTDPQGFLLGQGVAPGARLGSINLVTSSSSISETNVVRQMVLNTAHVMNNSWGYSGTGVNGGMPGAGYLSGSRTWDRLVRDPDTTTPALEQLAIVSAAGNEGAGGATSIGGPWEAKNPIIVGNSLNFRPGEADADDIRGLRSSSSRGPAVDGRILPTLVATGTDVVSARSTADSDTATPGVQRPRTPYTDTGATVHDNYTRLSGTSMASPHVAGLCALLIEWWRNRTGGTTPSIALLKALLVNGCEDLVGGPDGAGGTLGNIPDNNQGWGRVSLENMVLQAPASDRGPKAFADQTLAFTASGDEYTVRVGVAESTRPMRITLAYSDAPGAAGANPALVNNLNLEVEELSTGTIYRGNVFAGGFSTTGGAADTLNNVECVFVQNPVGAYEVRVLATSVVANARPPFDLTPWQDFALVLDNVELVSDQPAKVALVLDRSGSMVSSGYVDVTRQASKQFVDLSIVDDELGVVSFGDTGDVEFPTTPPPELQTVVGPATRAAARTEIDAIAFGGCTFMGQGIERGADLLAAETGQRGIVLLSDGYDNKGCDQGNPAKPSAMEAAAALPADLAIYSCAMGPASDQLLLEQLATSTGGQYFFMPDIDDLFEIYNYIRGAVTPDGVVANETSEASLSAVNAFVESVAERATFTCAWHDRSLRFTTSTPRKENQIAVRLRDPRGRRVHPAASFVRRHVGDGYVVFDVPDPAPGQWQVEVETARERHTRYTVGAFVRSPIRVRPRLRASRVAAGSPLTVMVQGGKRLSNLTASATVTRPVMGIPQIRSKFKDRLAGVQPRPDDSRDQPPGDLAKLMALHPQLLKEGTDIFARRSARITLSSGPAPRPRPAPGPRPGFATGPRPGFGSGPQPAPVRKPLIGRAPTSQPGSYNVHVTVTGMSGRTRFVRRHMLSAVVS